MKGARAWMDRAICRDPDPDQPDLMYPDEEELSTAEYAMAVNAARTTCARCPVMSRCLAYAVDNGEVHGIWGGRTPKERADLAKQVIAM